MPTLEELHSQHRYAEKSVAQLITIADEITDAERGTFQVLQLKYKQLTTRGLKEKWLRKPHWARDTVVPCTDRKHPTRLTVADEPQSTHDRRVESLEAVIANDVRFTLNRVRDAQQLLRDWANTSVPVNFEDVRELARTKAEAGRRAETVRQRRQVNQPDSFTCEEWDEVAGKIALWIQLSDRGRAEGWLITKSHAFVPHDLAQHPRRTVQIFESEDVVAARIAGLDRYLAARVTTNAE